MDMQLPSNSGRHIATWTVTDQTDGHLSCDFEFRLQTFEDGQPYTVIQFSRLILCKSGLSEFAQVADDWLSQPISGGASHDFDAAVDMGGGFDNYIRLRFGGNPAVISAQNIAATFDYCVAGVNGEFAYVVDQTCLRVLVEGISAALSR